MTLLQRFMQEEDALGTVERLNHCRSPGLVAILKTVIRNWNGIYLLP